MILNLVSIMIFGLLLLVAQTSNATLCIAHRGNSSVELENSFSAIISAYETGAHGVEFDVRHTKDGVPIVFHDRDLNRLAQKKEGKDCPMHRNIDRLYFKTIRENCLLKNGEEIPKLDEVLSYLSDKPLLKFIELKDMPSLWTLEIIEKYLSHNAKSVRFLSFKKKILEYIDLHRDFFLGIGKMKNLHLYPIFICPKSDHGLNIRYTSGGLKRLEKYSDREIGVWTVNKTFTLKKLLKVKHLDYITTNFPERCQNLRDTQ